MTRAEIRDLYEERAAIMEFLGGLTRDEAERLAWADVSNRQLTGMTGEFTTANAGEGEGEGIK